jgi:putative DNA primase/helicase
MVELAKFFAHDFPDEAQLPRPRPLVQDERADPYPVWALPSLIRDAVEEVAGYVQAPAALIAAAALSAVSTAVQSCFSVERSLGLDGPATLFFLTVAESGERKSSVDGIFTADVREWQAAQGSTHRERMAAYRAALEDWERTDEELRRNIGANHIQVPAEANLDPRIIHEMNKPRKPVRRRLLREDDTQEALAVALAKYPVASIISAEAGTIFGSHGMNAEAVTRNLAQANQLWDGRLPHRGRVGSGDVEVEVVRVTMGLAVQPAVLEAFIAKTGGLARDIGFLARFLFSWPETAQGLRPFKEAPADRPGQRAFSARMQQLLSIEPQFDEHDRLLTKYVGFDDAASAVWVSFHDEVEEKLNYDHEYAGIRAVASKAADNAARIACCLHVFCGDHNQGIGRESVESATALMRWYLAEAVRYASSADAAPELADARLLEEWLVARVRQQPKQAAAVLISANKALKLGPARLRTKKRFDEALELLSDHYRVLLLRRMGRKGQDIYVRAEVLAEYSR